jgi:5-oxoprolinase (ATP-hydrolysing) subunit A
MATSIDLNADVGESFGPYSIGSDAELMRSITSANVAAGFHGGDPGVIRSTIRMALAHGVAVGAHPGFADLAGFGRREMHLAVQELEDLVLYQIAAVAGVAAAEGGRLHHVKAHGALYNMAARDDRLAGAIVRAMVAVDRSLVLYGPPGSCLLDAARAEGLTFAVEGFVDRSYEPDGRLTPRTVSGAVIHEPLAVVSRALRMVRQREVVAKDGSVLPLDLDTLCIHSDTPGADVLAAAVRAAFEQDGVQLAPMVCRARAGQ